MQFPDFIHRLPTLDLPVSDEIVTTSAIRSENGLAVIFTFHVDFEMPPHSHKGQWGTVVAGEVTLTMDGVTTTYRPGDSYDIPSGAEHSVHVTAGTIAIDIFEEPDRYTLRDEPSSD